MNLEQPALESDVGVPNRGTTHRSFWSTVSSFIRTNSTERRTFDAVHYRADLDGLRAFAILSVMGFHAFPTVFRGGFTGVDTFFVLSGFLISSIIFKGLRDDTFRFIEFYSRRIRRIFPALIVVLAIALLAGFFVLFADEYANLAKGAAAGAAFAGNLWIWSTGTDYFQPAAKSTPLLHLWSLGIEEQFYLLWPLLLWLLWKSMRGALLLIIVVGAISFYLNIVTFHGNPIIDFYSPQTRFWELSIGSALAYLSLFRPRLLDQLTHPRAAAISVCGALLIGTGWLLISEVRNFPGWWALLPTLGTALIIAAGPEAYINRTVLSKTVFVWIGLISYPLYLWHWPLLSFRYVLSNGAPAFLPRLIALLAAVVLAAITYMFIERPIRSNARLRPLAATLVLLMSGIAYLGYRAYESVKFNQLSLAPSAAALHYVSDRDEFNYLGFINGLRFPRCIADVLSVKVPVCRISESAKVTVALIGDSHAAAIFPFVNQRIQALKRGVILLGSLGCPPFLGVERRDRGGCPQVMANAVEYVNENSAITDVILTGRFAAALSGLDFGERTPDGFYRLSLVNDPSVTERRAIFQIGLQSMVRALIQHRKRVTILLDVPELDFDPRSCAQSRGRRKCTVARSAVEARQSPYTEVIRGLQRQYGYTVIDLKDALCDTRLCSAEFENHILYMDSHHVGINGNVFLSRSGIRLLGPESGDATPRAADIE